MSKKKASKKAGRRVVAEAALIEESDAPAIPTTNKPARPESDFIVDYVSGKQVRATPEEVQAVQVFAHRLVDELGYGKELIQTRPQFRVRARPSGTTSRGYPVDIAVFNDKKKLEDEVAIVVECKRKTRTDGEKQLKIYLQMCSATLGVWFNGEDHLYLHKRLLKNGSIEWVVLPSLPRRGQSIDDIGSLSRQDLVKPANLKSVFRDIRNHLAGNTVGITTDQRLAQEIMSLLFCKIFDELDTGPAEQTRFRAKVGEDENRVAQRVHELFEAVKKEYPDVFQPDETITLDNRSLSYVAGELQNYAIVEASRDAIGDAFEVFIGPAVRGKEGQFFTPRNVVQLMVGLIDPQPGEKLIDPACGSGGFLIVALEHVWSQLEVEAKRKNGRRRSSRRRNATLRCSACVVSTRIPFSRR